MLHLLLLLVVGVAEVGGEGVFAIAVVSVVLFCSWVLNMYEGQPNPKSVNFGGVVNNSVVVHQWE